MKCTICGSELQSIPVGRSPVAGYYCNTVVESLEQPVLPLEFLACPGCRMLTYRREEEAEPVLDQLYSGHFATYHFTKGMSEYMQWFVNDLTERYELNAGSRILELGCNSGRLLRLFRDTTGCSVQGVEPSKTFTSLWKEQQVDVINGYFGPELVKNLAGANYDVIFFRHVFEHIPDFLAFIEAVSELCTATSAVVIEVPYLATVIERSRIDNIGYSHLNYYSIRSLAEITRRVGLGITDFQLVETDGGSIIVHLRKGAETPDSVLDSIEPGDVRRFVKRIEEIRESLDATLAAYEPHEVVGYGAGAKGQHLVHLLGLKDKMNCVIDDTPELDGRYIPGTSLEIKLPARLDESGVRAIVNLVPTHAEAIRAKVSEEHRFIDPING